MPSRIPQKLKDLRDVSTIQADSLLQVADVVATVPRYVWFVYGGSTDGGTTPNTTTQASIDALLTAGIAETNIRWLYEEEGNTFVIADITSTPTIGGITLELAGGSFVIGDITTTPTIDNIVLINADTLEFIIADVTATPTIENIVLELAGGLFAMADLTATPTIEEITLVLAGGTFTIAGITTTTTIDNITLVEEAGVSFTDPFDTFDTAAWDTAPSSAMYVIGGHATTLSGVLSAFAKRLDAFAAAQYCGGLRYGDLTGGPGQGFMTRVTGDMTTNYNDTCGYALTRANYEDDEDPGNFYIWFQLWKVTNGTLATELGSWQVSYPYMRLESNGNTHTVKGKVNAGDSWTTIDSVTDATYTTGVPGIWCNVGGSIDSCEGGEL